MEPLEQRIAPAVFLVSTPADSGNGSLRDAIDRANIAPGVDTIQFQIPGGGLQTILLQSALPTITEAVTIDGYSQPGSQANTLTTGNNAVLQIELKGGNFAGDGLRITGGGSTIRGLVINGFGIGGQGIEIVGGGGNIIEGCFIGTDSTGNVDLGNLGGGILINGSSSNRVGGPTPAARNVISGNESAGIEISGTGAGNVFVNNYIGVNAAGTAAIPNTIGILLGGSETRIGGTLAAERNIVSGNTIGIHSSDGVPVAGVVIQGNYIGTNATGSAAVPNNIGLLLDGGSGIYIGGDDDDDGAADGNIGARNVISGNNTHGISLSTSDSSLRIQGNYIGTDAAGTSGLGNGQNGIQTDSGSGPYLIGGASAGAGNLISGNGLHGISIAGDGGNKTIQGNRIGTDASGTTAISNAENGIRMAGGGNIVGGTTAAARNLISGNKDDGIEISGGGSNSFQGNYIGTKIDGTTPLENGGNGIFISGSVDDNQIGGIGAGAANVIAYNGKDGIYVVAGVENTIRGNSIFGNADLGIDLGTNGVTPNDLNDGDDGANLLQNYPILTSVNRVSTSYSVNGTLQSIPQGSFTIDLYSIPAADSSGSGEGRTYLGSTTITADSFGNANFSLIVPVQLPTGSYLSATATRADGNTSEFSAALVVGGEFIWDGGGGADTSWFNPLNWDRDSGVPGPDDIATLNINATITINSNVQVGILNQSAGAITGTAALSVIEGFNWSGGTQAGTGTTRIPGGSTPSNPGALLAISGGAGKTLDQRTLDMQGTALVTGTGTVTLTNGATINNGGIFDLQSDADFLYSNNGSPAVQFINSSGALLRKTAGNGMTEFGGLQLLFNNFGEVEVQTGLIRLNGSGGSGLGAAFKISPGAEFEFNAGAYDLDGSEDGGTAISISGGGVVSVTGGTVNLGDTLVFGSGSLVKVVGGTLNTYGTMEVSNDARFEQTGGELSGTGLLAIEGEYKWTGGTQAGTGRTLIAIGGKLDIGGPDLKFLDQRTLDNEGQTTVTGAGGIMLGNAAKINNSGLFDLQSDADLNYTHNGSPAVAFNNLAAGILRKSVGIEASAFTNGALSFNNFGKVEVLTGALRFTGSGGTHTNGIFSVAPNAMLEFASGSHTFNGGTSFEGGGSVLVSGGELTLAAAPPSFVPLPGVAVVASGTGLTQTGGTILGGGTLSIVGAFVWSGGTQGGVGVTRIETGATLEIAEEPGKTLSQRTLEVLGTARVTGSGSLTLSSGAAIFNRGLFELQSDADFIYPNDGSAAVQFTNQIGATLRKLTGTGISEFRGSNFNFNNSGTVDVRSGTLRAAGSGGSGSGPTFLVSPGAVLEFGAGTYNLTQNGSSIVNFAGGGVVAFNGATVNLGTTLVSGAGTQLHLLAGAVNANATMDLPAGTRLEHSGGTLGGAGTLLVGGAYQWSGGTQAGSGVTQIATGASFAISGASNKNLDQRTLDLRGGTTITGDGNLMLRNGAVINNRGLFELQSGADVLYPNDGTPAVQFNNLSGGTLRTLAGGGVTEFAGSNISFNNAGIVEIQTGTVLVFTAFTQTAGSLILSGGNTGTGTLLSLEGGELTGSGYITGNVLNSGATIRTGGSGQAGALNVSGNYTQGPGGTLAVDLGGTNAGMFDVLTVEGIATLSGTLDITNIGGFAPGAGHQFRVVSSENNPGPFATLSGQTAGLTQTADVFGLVINTPAAPTQPDLALTSTDGVNETTPGSALIYTLTYSNSGTRISNGVRLTETLPAGASFNPAASSPGWTEVVAGSGIYTFLIGSLAPGAGGNVTFAVTVDAVAPAGLNNISNSATISDDGQNGIDAIPANNTATDSTTLIASPDLQVSIASNDVIVKRGGKISYTLSYQNTGNQNAAGVVLTQTLPQNASFNATASTAGWTETSPGSRVYQLAIGSLPAGAQNTATFAIQFAANLPTSVAGATTVVSIADNFDLNETDPTPLNNSAELSTPVYQGVYILAPGVPVRLKDAAPPTVRVFNIATGVEAFRFDAYESTYRDSVRLAVGDINGDGYDDIITSKRTGTGQIRVFDGLTGTQFSGPLGQIDPFDGLTRASRGAFVASGDVTGDGRDDIIAGSALGGGTVKIYDGVTGTLVSTYQPFGPKFKGGVRVAVGDVNGDGKDDVIVGQGSAGSQVKVYDGATSNVLQNFKVGPKAYRGGVFVASGDFDGDGRADILTGRDIGSSPLVETFSGIDHHKINSILAFNAKFKNGVRVSAADVNLDGIADIIVTSGTKNRSTVKVFDGQTGQPVLNFEAFPDFPDSSLFVASSTTVPISGNND